MGMRKALFTHLYSLTSKTVAQNSSRGMVKFLSDATPLIRKISLTRWRMMNPMCLRLGLVLTRC